MIERVRRPARVAVVVLAALLAACVVSCGSPRVDERTRGTGATGRHLVGTEAYLDGADADLYLPDAEERVPLVVLVPGGSWLTADRRGLAPLAERLADAGMAVVNATYRAAESGATFPGPVGDVLCAVAYGVARTAARGRTPGPVIVLGHSAGAHLAALAVLPGNRFAAACAYPIVVPDALAGLAGIYDVAAYAALALPLFGVSPGSDPARWRDGNALTWVEARPDVPVFLAHGADDDLLPTTTTQQFAEALQRAGHAVRVEIMGGADHYRIFAPDVIAAVLIDWIESSTHVR